MKKILVLFLFLFCCFSCVKKSNSDENLLILKICNKQLRAINSVQSCVILSNLKGFKYKYHESYAVNTLEKKLAKNFELYSSVISKLETLGEQTSITSKDIEDYSLIRNAYLSNTYDCVNFYSNNRIALLNKDKDIQYLLSIFQHNDFNSNSNMDIEDLLKIEKQKMVCSLIFLNYFGELATVISLGES